MFTLSACGQIVVTETDKFQANTVIPAVASRSASGWLPSSALRMNTQSLNLNCYTNFGGEERRIFTTRTRFESHLLLHTFTLTPRFPLETSLWLNPWRSGQNAELIHMHEEQQAYNLFSELDSCFGGTKEQDVRR